VCAGRRVDPQLWRPRGPGTGSYEGPIASRDAFAQRDLDDIGRAGGACPQGAAVPVGQVGGELIALVGPPPQEGHVQVGPGDRDRHVDTSEWVPGVGRARPRAFGARVRSITAFSQRQVAGRPADAPLGTVGPSSQIQVSSRLVSSRSRRPWPPRSSHRAARWRRRYRAGT